MIKSLLTTSGRSVQDHIRTEGSFELRLGNHILSFLYLEDAYQCFLDIEEEVTLWDVTSITELLESKVRDN